MNSWSRTRKRIILVIVFLIVIVLVGVPLYLLLYKAPSCSDGVMNGDESGIDCGGSCQLLCSAESLPLVMRGDPRVLVVATTTATSTYEVVALFDNPNSQAEISRAHYTVKVFDRESSLPIRTFEGNTFVPKGKKFAIFIDPFNVDSNIVPSRAILEWDKKTLVWQKNINEVPEIEVTEEVLSREEFSPRLDALVENRSLERVSNIDLVAVLSDGNGNTFAASRTFIESLEPNESIPIIFTWPRPFNAKVAQMDILTRVLPDRSYLK